MVHSIARPFGRGKRAALVAAAVITAAGLLSSKSARADVVFVSPEGGTPAAVSVSGRDTFTDWSPASPGGTDLLGGGFSVAIWSINPLAAVNPGLFGVPVLFFPVPDEPGQVGTSNAGLGLDPGLPAASVDNQLSASNAGLGNQEVDKSK